MFNKKVYILKFSIIAILPVTFDCTNSRDCGFESSILNENISCARRSLKKFIICNQTNKRE